MKIGILIDSGGAITNEEILKTKNIDIIPLHVVLGDNTEFLDINENILKHNVFERVSNKEAVSTSMASPGELEEKYDEMLKIYDHIYHLTITPNLSGMKNTALMVSQDEKYTGKITVVDHFTAANGIKYTALKMRQLADKGITDPEEYKKVADEASNKIFLGLIPGDISKLNKGGRAKGILINLLKIIKTKFLIQWGEHPKNAGLSRTVKGIVKKATNIGFEMSGNDAKVILVKTIKTNDELVETAKKELDANGITYTVELIPSIYGCHAGTETIGIIMIPQTLL